MLLILMINLGADLGRNNITFEYFSSEITHFYLEPMCEDIQSYIRIWFLLPII